MSVMVQQFLLDYAYIYIYIYMYVYIYIYIIYEYAYIYTQESRFGVSREMIWPRADVSNSGVDFMHNSFLFRIFLCFLKQNTLGNFCLVLCFGSRQYMAPS